MIGLRDIARNHVKACIPCKLMRKRACEQRMRQLPSYRTDASNPVFAKTALDLFGPFEVKVERKTIKEAWCCIFTCMTTRAVHLELCTDKSTDTFFQKIRMPKRTPEIGLVRRGTNFAGSQRYLQEMVQEWNQV